MEKTILIKKAFDDYNNTVSSDYFLQFSEAKKDLLMKTGGILNI